MQMEIRKLTRKCHKLDRNFFVDKKKNERSQYLED